MLSRLVCSPRADHAHRAIGDAGAGVGERPAYQAKESSDLSDGGSSPSGGAIKQRDKERLDRSGPADGFEDNTSPDVDGRDAMEWRARRRAVETADVLAAAIAGPGPVPRMVGLS